MSRPSTKLVTGDCVQELAKLPENSVSSIVCDPPYGLKFMQKEFDDLGEGAQQREWHRLWAVEALRVLKPGGHLLAFGGTRTYHHLATAVEEAGFEIRDQIQWLYGSGFPKSLNVGKAIDKKRDDQKEIYQVTAWIREARNKAGKKNSDIDGAFGFAGMAGHWTSQKSQPAVPTLEQIPKLLEVLGVKPEDVPEDIRRLIYELNGKKGQPGENWFKREVVGKSKKPKPTYHTAEIGTDAVANETDLTAPATDEAARWEGWGTALKPANEPIVVARKPFRGTVAENVQEWGTGAMNIEEARIGGKEGRWPANVILDEEAGELLDEQSGIAAKGKRSAPKARKRNNGVGLGNQELRNGKSNAPDNYGDQGGASRFFYCPKAAKKERNAGMPEGNKHPTVKPVKLMAYLIRLITPPGGTVLDPFLGSGSTGLAAIEEGVSFIGIEKDPEYMKIAKARIEHWTKELQEEAEEQEAKKQEAKEPK